MGVSWRRTASVAVAAATVLLVGSIGVETAMAGTGIVRSVVNADGGVYWRTSTPDWGNPIANPGYGVYNGDQVELECWTTGSTVPPYNNNTLWYDAKVVAGQGLGEGFVNDHFIDTGVNVPNQVVEGVPQCGASAPSSPVQVTPGGASAPAALQFPVVDAAGGVYFRTSPRWASARAVSGDGVYTGDVVQLICGASGDAVGPFSNTWWSYVTNVSRPNLAPGWVNEHFIADGAPSGQGPAGEPACGAATPGVLFLQPTLPGSILQPAGGSQGLGPAGSSEVCKQYSGDRIADTGSMAGSLFGHYIAGSGRPVVIDWSFFANNAAFVNRARQLTLNSPQGYMAGPASDMYEALGRFTITRTSTHCFSVYDHYDFTPPGPYGTNLPFLPLWAGQLVGAREFYVHASGTL